MNADKQYEPINQVLVNSKAEKLKSEIGRYPKIKRGERIYVRYPVQIQELDLGKTVAKLTVGKWMAVNVHLPEGYTRLIAPAQFDTEADCRKACDMHNDYYKFTKKQVLQIVSASMQASVEREEND